MFSIDGTKFTTARHSAEQAIHRIVAGLGQPAGHCHTAHERLDEMADPGDELVAVARTAEVELDWTG